MREWNNACRERDRTGGARDERKINVDMWHCVHWRKNENREKRRKKR